MKLIRLLATAMAGAATLLLLRRRPRRLRLDRARATLFANRGAAAGQIGTGPLRSDEQIYYSI